MLAVLPVVGFTTNRLLGRLVEYPFTLGVASGDPSPDGVVIWTRLARPMPVERRRPRRMPARVVDVEWEVAADERFTRVVQRESTAATPQLAHSVHVELTGLRPGTDYFYRFRVDGHLSPVGRTRTAPDPGSLSEPLTMCFASCANYEQGCSPPIAGSLRNSRILFFSLAITNTSFRPGTFANGPIRTVGGEPLTLAELSAALRAIQARPGSTGGACGGALGWWCSMTMR